MYSASRIQKGEMEELKRLDGSFGVRHFGRLFRTPWDEWALWCRESAAICGVFAEAAVALHLLTAFILNRRAK
jgi:hypothetical protein